ncbi:MAG: hypothetical protein IPH44_20530 [Myxococcales bacterium]|nr:hypothetical protein [Myxococcales bacterium]MBK7195204.1 hypothetical protein [Myxococcales bacterium]MBP6845085.1 hypothetical protein [Kofleriaceae bacterium]
MRTLLVIATLLGSIAPAEARPRTEAAVAAANEAAFARALRAKGLTVVAVTERAREPDGGAADLDPADPAHVDAVVPSGLTAVVVEDRRGALHVVVRQPRITGTVRGTVCHAGPQRPPPPPTERVHLTIPTDRPLGAPVVVRYPTRRFVGANTCR